MKQTLKKMVFIVFAGCCIATSYAETPNIVFIVVDDLGANSLGSYGSTFHRTPNMDRLSAQGMKFTQAYSAGPNCSPTRASILFGQYPARLRVTDWIPGREAPHAKLRCPVHNFFVPVDTPSIPSLLKLLGYKTAMIGKWHISRIGDKEHEPSDYGFDVVFEDWGLNSDSTPEDPKGVSTLTDKAIEFMKANREQPFFLMLSHYSVHNPIQFSPDVKAQYEARVDPASGQKNPKFAAMLDALDGSVGRLLDEMTELGLDENTVVFFYSDNGGISQHASNAPLRGQKAMLYEGGVRVPLVVRWPGHVKAGSVNDAVVTSVDLLPTFVELAGSSAGIPSADGLSLVNVFTQEKALGREAIYWHYPHYNKTKPVGVVRAGRYKLLNFYEDDRVELYDLEKDIGEQQDLSRSMPEKASELKRKLTVWKDQVDAQEPVPNPNYNPKKAHIQKRRKD